MVGGAMNSSMTRAVWGALAGVAGGLAMTLMIQKVAPNVLPEAMRPDGFAPKKAVEWTEAKTEHPEALTERQEMKAAMVGHLGYSAAAGAVYGVARENLRRVPAPLTGAALGLVLWGLSFEGWMPAVGIMERTTDKPLAKWPAPIMGHVLYGVVTALAFEGLETLQGRTEERAHAVPERVHPELNMSV
jgi:uncharacterized membrane protein YagU involved in acid resistance